MGNRSQLDQIGLFVHDKLNSVLFSWEARNVRVPGKHVGNFAGRLSAHAPSENNFINESLTHCICWNNDYSRRIR